MSGLKFRSVGNRESHMKQSALPIVFAVLNAVGVAATIVINGLANSLPIAGNTTGELSDSYPNLFVPAGFTFAIWGVIYLLLIAFAVYQLVGVFRDSLDVKRAVMTIHIWFAVASIGNIAWIFAWHYERVVLSLLFMLVLLAALLIIYQRLGISYGGAVNPAGDGGSAGGGSVGAATTPVGDGGSPAAGDAGSPGPAARPYRWFLLIPMSVYLGWITVATVANVTAVLVDLGWAGFGISEAIWAAVVIVVAFALGLLMLAFRGDVAYVLVVIWAFFGIFMKRLATDPGETTVVYATAAACGVVLILAVLYRLVTARS